MREERNHTEMHVGSFTGHIVPGSMFLLVGLLNSIHVYHHYFTSRRKNVTYKAMHGRPLWFFHNSSTRLRQLEAIARLLLTVAGIIGELATSYNGELQMFTNKMMHAEHITMFAGFGISAFVDIWSYGQTYGCLPEGADYFCGAGAVLIEFVLFLYHLHGRSLLNTHVHIILIYVIGMMAISTITEFIFSDRVIWSITRPYFTWLQGTWFYQIAFMLFNPANDSKPILDEDDPESVMVATLYIAGHIVFGFAVQLTIGSAVYVWHGRPRSRPQEYIKLDTLSGTYSTGSGSTSSTTRNESDMEETSNLLHDMA